MSLRILLLLFFLPIFSGLLAQKANNCYTELRQEGVRLLEKKDFRNAIDKFFAARYCPDKPTKDDLDNLIKRTQNQWVKALDDAKKATERALAKADSLIAYFGFSQDRAWAYKNGKFAVIDRSGKRLTDFEFENPEPFKQSGYAIAQKTDGFYYLIDKSGKVSEPYNYFFPCNNGWYKVKKGNLYTFYDKNFKQVEGWDWCDQIYDFQEGRVMVQQNKKWGIRYINGKFLIPPQLDGPFSFSEGLAGVIKDKKWCYIDTTGKIILETVYDSGGNFFENMALVIKDNKLGFINKTGQIIIPIQYDAIDAFERDIAKMAKNGNWGYIRKDGTVIIPPQFEEALLFYDGAAAVKKGKLWGLIDTTGNFIIQPEFSQVDHNFNNNDFIKVQKDFKWGLINRTGRFVVPLEYDLILFNQSETVIKVEKHDRWGLIDLTGNVLIPPQFVEIGNAGVPHLFIVENMEGKKGYLNSTNGAFLFEPQFEYAEVFMNGVAIVKKDGMYRHVDTTGKFIEINQANSSVTPNGNKWEEKNGKWGFLDRNGKVLLDYQFDEPSTFSEGMAAVRKSGKWGIINKDGNVIVAPQFDDFGSFEYRKLNIIRFIDGVVSVKKNTRWGLIDKNGKILIEPKFGGLNGFKDGRIYSSIYGEPFTINHKGELIIDEALEKKE